MSVSPDVPVIALRGANGGGTDFSCNGIAQTADKCACQVKCLPPRCQNAVAICRTLQQCAIVSLNGKTRRASSWATLKAVRRGDETWSNETAAREQAERRQAIREPPPPPLLPPLPVGASPLCGRMRSPSHAISTVGLFVLTYRTPRSLEWSMRSWEQNGLLERMAQKMLLANDPQQIELLLGKAFGFEVLEPRLMKGVTQVKPNVVTIGQAFAWAMANMATDSVLFLEKDFPLVMPAHQVDVQLSAAATMLSRGVAVVYLRSRTQQGCDSFLGCSAVPWVDRGGSWATRTNWWKFYCDGFEKAGRVADCIGDAHNASGVRLRCYTSEDANWSLNAALINRRRAMRKRLWEGGQTLAELGQAAARRQDAFENDMLQRNWGKYKVPLCISYDGLFTHYEVDG